MKTKTFSSALLLLLVSAYVVHYFRLENAVQRWYHLGNRLDQLAGRPTPCYEGGEIRRGGESPGS